MKRNEIRKLIRNSIKRSVRICMDDGKTYTVAHPDFALAAPNAVLLASGPGHAFGASFVICGGEHISRVEILDRPKAKAGKS
ncbi:MAG: hypothetical protein HZA90_16055 [Verrucomicrobia bacterium]|nr:hypothetical protein [Verrucomicrobiota bacterium]